jgi:hypothetical protein
MLLPPNNNVTRRACNARVVEQWKCALEQCSRRWKHKKRTRMHCSGRRSHRNASRTTGFAACMNALAPRTEMERILYLSFRSNCASGKTILTSSPAPEASGVGQGRVNRA